MKFDERLKSLFEEPSEDDVQIDLFRGMPHKVQTVSTVFLKNSLITFRYNAHLKKSIRYSQGGIFGKPEIILPKYMEREEFEASRELAAAWAECAVKRKTVKNKAQIKDLIERFWQSVEQTLSDLGEKSLSMRGRLPPIAPKGKVHDLEQILAAVNETYFNGELECRITWSNRIGGLSFHTMRHDPVTGEKFHLISISGGYDMDNCPLYAVAGVVYHECLHIAIPPEVRNGRRVVHGKLFKQREKRYMYYDEWMKWHKEILPLNIRKLRRRSRREK